MRFALLLARTLGRTYDELLDTMTGEEFALWLAEYQRSPWGEVRSDVRNASLQALIANIHRDTKRRADPYTTRDFILRDRTDNPRTFEDTMQIVNQFNGG